MTLGTKYNTYWYIGYTSYYLIGDGSVKKKKLKKNYYMYVECIHVVLCLLTEYRAWYCIIKNYD